MHLSESCAGTGFGAGRYPVVGWRTRRSRRVEGCTRGQAHVSPTHGNFIVNEGNASAGEVRALIERQTRRLSAVAAFRGLREEIVSMGFESATDEPGNTAESERTEG